MTIQGLLGLACLGDCLACCSYCSNARASCDSYMLAAILGLLLGCRGLGGAWRGGGAPGSSQCWGDRSVKVLQSGQPRDGDPTAVVALPLRDLNVSTCIKVIRSAPSPAAQRWAFAAMAPAAAPMASHLALRVIRRRRLPPLAARTASSRSRVKTAALARSSARSA